jgi:FkbM family methyltransferase
VKLEGGVELELHPEGDYVSDLIRATGDHHEVRILEEVRERLFHDPGVIVDAGAMIGNHAAYFAHHVRHTVVHAFEPEPSNLALLERNVARYPTVHVHPVALSDHHGQAALHNDDERNRGHAQLRPGEGVQLVTLDGLELEWVTLLKVDVEGHELEVLAGAAGTIRRWRPLILIEDWQLSYGRALGELGYGLVAAWPQHQTYLYEYRGG